MRGTPQERFLAKVSKPESPEGCWIWQAAILQGGYGQFWFGSRMHHAHRIAYLLFVAPLPDGVDLDIDHLCHTNDTACVGGQTCPHRRCVNPAHLEAVTPRVNALRGRGIAAANAAKTHCPQGHPYDTANTYRRPRGGRICIKCDRAAGHRYDERRRAA